MRRPLPAAVLFDMDGLLIDSERLALASVAQAAVAIGWKIPDDVAHRLIGLGRDNGSHVLLSALGDDFPVLSFWESWLANYRDRVGAGVPAKTGATHALEALQALIVRCAVATSTETELARHKLDKAGLLRYFDVVVGRDTVAHGKPSPDLYLHAASRLGAIAAQCWAFEDSLPGLTAAVAAGARTHWVPDIAKIHADDLPSGVETIESLHEICRWLGVANDPASL